MIKTIEWTDEGVRMIDQRKLPGEEVYPVFRTYQEVAQAIKNMVIRGAPAIGVAAGMGIALGIRDSKAKTVEELESELQEIGRVIGATRPTAVNLFWAIERMKRTFAQAKRQQASIEQIKQRMVEEAKWMCEEDILINQRMGRYGASLIPDQANVLTHCNAGTLATAGYGTALGVIRAAVEQHKKIHVLADETRPFLQGARLTAWELHNDGIPVTLISDNMAGYFMRQGKVDCVIVGADRIAANGDVANKIGTYSLAVLAKEHGIPFYVAAPISTVDLSLASGDEIPIEERASAEITKIKNHVIAPEGIRVANPAFDVTPHHYVTAIITERGIARPPYTESLKALASASATAQTSD
ncbi:MAG: S-methyl-5-thioribose-1-phosphate isomerase [Acidobacteria bacterium]|nr:S-methyl-5-thioribose-1-phosphate isomerase [Acidobacteriota bacterium]